MAAAPADTGEIAAGLVQLRQFRRQVRRPESKTAGWKARPPMLFAANAALPRSVALFRRDLLTAVAHALLGGEEGIVEV